MFGIRTPIKKADGEKPPRKTPPAPVKSVRRSVGEWETARANPGSRATEMDTQAGPSKLAPKAAQTHPSPTLPPRGTPEQASPPPKPQYADRTAEARAFLTKAKIHLNNSRNLKTEIKTAILEALDRLYQLVKEGEAEKTPMPAPTPTAQAPAAPETAPLLLEAQRTLTSQIAEHTQLLRDSSRRMEALTEVIHKHRDEMERGATRTYATVAAANDPASPRVPSRATLHSIVVTSTDKQETGEEVLEKVRKAVDAKEGWVKVERVRKAKDQKVIMGFSTTQDRDRVKERLIREKNHLKVEEVTNRDPLLILRSVLSVNTDEDVTKALKQQNREVFHNLDTGEERIEIKYRKKTRNPHACHVIISVSPKVWKRATELGRLHVDLQRVVVEDQSPLVQCSRCLGFGHGRKFCHDTEDVCSHCGGQHHRAQCQEWLTETPPICVNCTKIKAQKADHNAFSSDCPVRRKWDAIARSTVAYC